MSIKRSRPEIKKSRLENEVILAVVILYVLLSGALLAVHHFQPDGTETTTSSSSPSHSDFSVGGAGTSSAAMPAAEPLTLSEAHQILARDGFEEIHGVRPSGKGFQATAVKDGKTWDVEIDAATRQIILTPQPVR